MIHIMNISEETITYVAALAKLELSEVEKEKAKVDLDKIISYIDSMKELNTDGIEPMSHAIPLKNVFREDVVTNGDDRENILANTNHKKDGSFMVPKTVE